MYKAAVNSIATTITGSIGAADTVFYVLDDSRVPDPPNLLVIGDNSSNAETVMLTAKDGNKLTVTRGFQGAARAWEAGTTVSRNSTAYDHDSFMDNIQSLNMAQATYEAASMPHTTSDGVFDYGFRVDGGNLIFVYEERSEQDG